MNVELSLTSCTHFRKWAGIA